MTGPEHIPWPNECGWNTCLAQQRLALRSHGDKGLHYGSWTSHTQINKVTHPRLARHLGRHLNRDEIDLLKLFRFRRTRVRRADQMHERMARRNLIG
jgi:hypothetical protein